MTHPSTLRGIRYARYGSYLFAALIATLGILDLAGGFSWGNFRIPPRWQPETVHYPLALKMECWFFIFYALLLVSPWEKIQSEQTWRKLFFVLCVFSILFSFVMISEVMAKNYIAKAAKTKARLPVFQAVLLFSALGQIPTLLFVRKPEMVD